MLYRDYEPFPNEQERLRSSGWTQCTTRSLLHAVTPVFEAANEHSRENSLGEPFPKQEMKGRFVSAILDRGDKAPSGEDDDLPIIWHATCAQRHKLRNRYVVVDIRHSPALPITRVYQGNNTDAQGEHTSYCGIVLPDDACYKPKDDFWNIIGHCVDGRTTTQVGTIILLRFIKDFEATRTSGLVEWMTSRDNYEARMNVMPFYDSRKSLADAGKNAKKKMVKEKGDILQASENYQWNATGAVAAQIESALHDGSRLGIIRAAEKGMTGPLFQCLLRWRLDYNNLRVKLANMSSKKLRTSAVEEFRESLDLL